MADLDHNLSLADALTEPSPDIEEEVKRDFIATLEAEKFDDVVGETVDKTDYVPLLDDDDAKAGSQEPKSKPHTDGIQVEHTSASGPVVVENGDHGMDGHRPVFPGEIMDEKLSYKEFLDRNDSWTMDDRDLCFEPQPVFRPVEMADPFGAHRGDTLPDLAFPTDMRNVQLFTDHADASRDICAPHGSVMVPEQPFLGPTYCSAEVLDPSAFIGLDSAAEFLQDKAVPEEHWMGAQHDVKGPDASFLVEPPVPPAVAEAKSLDLPESPAAATPYFVPTASAASPEEAAAPDAPAGAAPADAECVPASDVTSTPAEEGGPVIAGDTKPPQAADAGAAPPAEAEPLQGMAVGFAPAPEAKAPSAVGASTPGLDAGSSPVADARSPCATDLEFAPAADAGFAPAADTKPPHAVDLAFATADVQSHHAVDSEFASPAEANHLHALDLGFAPVAESKPSPAADSGFVSAPEARSAPAADTEVAASEEPMASESSAEHNKSPFCEPPAETTANVEQEPRAPQPAEEAEDSAAPPGPPQEQLPAPAAPVETKEDIALENKDLLPEKSVTAVDVTAAENQKEEAEHNHIQHAEPQQEKALQEPTGLPAAQIRQANKPSDRRFGRAKPAPVPIADGPEERPVGLAQQKSSDPRADPWSVAELGCVAGTPPRPRASPKKAAERPPPALPECAESCKDAPGESWDLEGSLAIVKKKKKKPKQKRNQLPRAQEFWDENVAVARAPKNSPFAAELQKADVGPTGPAEAHTEQPVASGSRASDVPKDAKVIPGSPVLGAPNACSVPAAGQQAPACSVLFESVLDAKNRDVTRAEVTRGDGLIPQSRGKRRQVPLEEVGEAKMGEPVTAQVPAKSVEGNFPDENEMREHRESECADPKATLPEAVSVSKVQTPLEIKPSEILLSGKDKDAKHVSPRQEASSDAVHCELQASGGSLPEAAKGRESCAKSREIANESCREPAPLRAAAPWNQLPSKPEAADEAKPVCSEKHVAAGVSPAGGALKTPAGAARMPVVPSVAQKPEEGVALQNRKADGFPEQPFLLAADSDAAQRPASAEAADRVTAAYSPDKNKGTGFIALEQQTGKDLSVAHGMDRPRKKRGEGKVKKIRSFSEQVAVLGDAGAGGVKADETIKETPFPDRGREAGFAVRGHPSNTHAYPADKPKKRGSDGKSKRGEKCFFQPPFLEGKMDLSSCPNTADNTREGSGKGGERGCVSAGCFQENASDVAEIQGPLELVTEEAKENAGKCETAGLGALDPQFLPLGRRDETKHLAMAGTISKTKEVDFTSEGKEAGVSSPGELVVIDSGTALVPDKPRKRCSDGRRKKSEKGAFGQPGILDTRVETANLPSKEEGAGEAKGVTSGKDEVPDFGREILLENLTGVRKEVLEKPETEGERKSSSNQPVPSGQKAEPAEPATNTEETWPTAKGEEAGVNTGAEAAVARGPTRELEAGKPKKKGREMKVRKAESSMEQPAALGPGSTPAVAGEVGNAEQSQSSGRDKENNSSTLGSLHLTGATEVQAPAVALEPEKSSASNEEKCKWAEASSKQPLLLEPRAGAETFPARGEETSAKPEAEGPAPCHSGAGLPGVEHPAVADHASAAVTDRSKKRGSDGRGKKPKTAPEQVAFPEAKMNRSEVQPPVGPEMEYGVEEMGFVDENRNIRSFPVGPEMLWNSEGSHLESFAAWLGPAGAAGCGKPEGREPGAGAEGLPSAAVAAERSSTEPGASAGKEIQGQKSHEQPTDEGHEERAEEAPKEEDGKAEEAGSWGRAEAGDLPSLGRSVQQDTKPKEEKVHLSPGAKVADKEARTSDKRQTADSTAADLPPKEAPVGAMGTEEPAGEKDAGPAGSRAAAGAAQAAAEALVEEKAEGAAPGGGRESQQGSVPCPGDGAEAASVGLAAAPAAQLHPKGSGEVRPQPAVGDAADAGGAPLEGVPAPKPEAGKAEGAAKEKEEESEQKTAKEAKKERARAAEQMKGYMRPTKARGVPALPARPAAQDGEKQRQLRATGASRQRQAKGVCV